jgi:hypothetical protein
MLELPGVLSAGRQVRTRPLECDGIRRNPNGVTADWPVNRIPHRLHQEDDGVNRYCPEAENCTSSPARPLLAFHNEVSAMMRPWITKGRIAALVLACLLGKTGHAWADPHEILSLKQLEHLSPGELEQIYARAEMGPLPTGCTRGQVLCLANTRLPRLKTCAFNLAWKGKCFEPDGSFVNRWPGFKALSSRAENGASWYDGRPSLVMEYAPGTPLFANLHDEIREIAPGLYLGRLYERCPCPRFVGFFALEQPCGR